MSDFDASRVVFVPGNGRDGVSSWPMQAHIPGAVFMTNRADGNAPFLDSRRVLRALGSGGHLVAASYGALAAMLVASKHPEKVRSLTLFEPACLSICASLPMTSAYIAALAPVYAKPLTDLEFAYEFAKATGEKLPDVSDAQLEMSARRLRRVAPPWTIPIDPSIVQLVPTVVVIGTTSAIYTEVALELWAHGAKLVSVEGSGHRTQDSPEGMEALLKQLAAQ